MLILTFLLFQWKCWKILSFWVRSKTNERTKVFQKTDKKKNKKKFRVRLLLIFARWIKEKCYNVFLLCKILRVATKFNPTLQADFSFTRTIDESNSKVFWTLCNSEFKLRRLNWLWIWPNYEILFTERPIIGKISYRRSSTVQVRRSGFRFEFHWDAIHKELHGMSNSTPLLTSQWTFDDSRKLNSKCLFSSNVFLKTARWHQPKKGSSGTGMIVECVVLCVERSRSR